MGSSLRVSQEILCIAKSMTANCSAECPTQQAYNFDSAYFQHMKSLLFADTSFACSVGDDNRDARQETNQDWTCPLTTPHRFHCFHTTTWRVRASSRLPSETSLPNRLRPRRLGRKQTLWQPKWSPNECEMWCGVMWCNVLCCVLWCLLCVVVYCCCIIVVL